MKYSKRGNNVEGRIIGETKHLAKVCLMYFRACPQNPAMFSECYHEHHRRGRGTDKGNIGRVMNKLKNSSSLPALRGKKSRGENWWQLEKKTF